MVEDGVVRRITDARDWFLQNLVDLVNHTGVSIGITLTVGGVLVSGQLTSGKKYFEEFGKTFAGGFKDGDPEFIAYLEKVYSQYGDIYAPSKSKGEHKELPSYVHLKDVHIFSAPGRPIPTEDGNWWRGRICEVQGFMLGSLNFPDE
ncbi:hypothetical protein IHQ72_33200 [Mesorhizobium onobrychidis]|uniref:Gas vesicle protein n=1 Tax=Mesorhizobium onobrychidis TaxID=2775404 RepID=A0ABY5R6X2_9HYPH|nr:hypothetical protein IHQ72_33200 [Mesorhizobium onobrychidis]